MLPFLSSTSILSTSKPFNFLNLWQFFAFCTLFQRMYIFLELQHTELKTKLLQTLYWCWMQQKDYFTCFGIISCMCYPWFLLTKRCLVFIWRGKPAWFGVLVCLVFSLEKDSSTFIVHFILLEDYRNPSSTSMTTSVISILEINQTRNLSITQLGLNQTVFRHCVRRMQLWFHWSQWNCIYWIMPYSQTVNIWYAKDSDIQGIKDLRKSIIYVFGTFGLEKTVQCFSSEMNIHSLQVIVCFSVRNRIWETTLLWLRVEIQKISEQEHKMRSLNITETYENTKLSTE